jgi:hypothetical protein
LPQRIRFEISIDGKKALDPTCLIGLSHRIEEVGRIKRSADPATDRVGTPHAGSASLRSLIRLWDVAYDDDACFEIVPRARPAAPVAPGPGGRDTGRPRNCETPLAPPSTGSPLP